MANYTVAKITMDCNFSPVLQYKQAIKKKDQTDSSGNFVYDGSGSIFVDESGNIIERENGPVQYEASGNIYYKKEEGVTRLVLDDTSRDPQCFKLAYGVPKNLGLHIIN